MNRYKAVFLDRDGVINHVVFHKEVNKPSSPWNIEEFKLIKGIYKPLMKLKKMGFLLFIISNQPDINRGRIKNGTTEKINKIIYEKFPIEDIMICPHDDKDNCVCRKPKPGMIEIIAKKYNINIKESFLIGDGWKDIEAGKKAGLTTILIDKDYNRDAKADYRVKNLEKSFEIIKNIDSK